MADIILGCWARISPGNQPISPSSMFLAIKNGSDETILADVRIVEDSATFVGAIRTQSSWHLSVRNNNGAGLTTTNVNNPFTEMTIGQNSTTWPRSNWPTKLWALRIKTSSVGASTDGEVEVRIDGIPIVNLTGVAVFGLGVDATMFAVGINGDIDNIWAVNGTTFPTVDANGVFTVAPSQLIFFEDFAGGDRSAWLDWEIFPSFTPTPYMLSDAGASGGYGASKWNSSPSTGSPTGARPYAGLKRTVVPIGGSLVAGVTGTVTSTRCVLFSLDGNTNTRGTPGLFTICGNLEVTGTSTGTSNVNTELDGLGT